MNAPSVDIKDILEQTSSLALVFGTDLFVSEMPDTPDECVVVYDSGGDDSDPHITYERPTIQIRVRGNKGAYTDTYDIVNNIKTILHGLTGEILNSARYIGIWIVGDILSLGQDDNKRPIFSINFRLHRTDDV